MNDCSCPNKNLRVPDANLGYSSCWKRSRWQYVGLFVRFWQRRTLDTEKFDGCCAESCLPGKGSGTTVRALQGRSQCSPGCVDDHHAVQDHAARRIKVTFQA